METELNDGNDFDGLSKRVMETYPADVMSIFCGEDVHVDTELLDGPTENPRQRSRQMDKVFIARGKNGTRDKVYLIEVQVKRTTDFQERMASYWASAALRYPRKTHEIRQVAIWPRGHGYDPTFERDGLTLIY